MRKIKRTITFTERISQPTHSTAIITQPTFTAVTTLPRRLTLLSLFHQNLLSWSLRWKPFLRVPLRLETPSLRRAQLNLSRLSLTLTTPAGVAAATTTAIAVTAIKYDCSPHSHGFYYDPLTSAPTTTTTTSTKRKRTTRRRLTTTQKIAHNKIEKKYRTNINDKIFRLEDLITAFDGDIHPPQPEDSDKKECPNKSKILERAATFIKHLKTTNLKLLENNSALQSRLAQYE